MKAPKTDNKPRDPFPAGTHNAVCYGVVDLGTQEVVWQDQKKMQRKVRIQWEVPALRVNYTKDDKELEGPKVIGKTYTFSAYQKAALAQHLTAWGLTDLDNLDFKTLIGKPCMLNVAHMQTNDNETISYIAAVMQMPQGMPEMKMENPELYYSIDEHGLNIPPNIYPWMQEIIKKSPEYNNAGSPPQNQEAPIDYTQPPTDDIPF